MHVAALTEDNCAKTTRASWRQSGVEGPASPFRICGNDWSARGQTFELAGVEGITLLKTSGDRNWRNCYASLQSVQPGSQSFEPCKNLAISFCWDTRMALTRTSGVTRRRGVLRFGSFNVIPAGERVEAEVESRFQSLIVYIAKAQLDEVCGMFGQSMDFDVDLDSGFDLRDPFIRASAQGIYAALVHGSADDDRYAEFHAIALAARLVHIFSRQAPKIDDRQKPPCRIRSEFAGIPTYVDEHLHEPITVQDLSRLTSTRTRQFSRIFQNDFGVSPYRYVMKARIDRAQELISSTDRSISDICFVCGFSDQSYFTKVFRKYVGCNPTDFRN